MWQNEQEANVYEGVKLNGMFNVQNIYFENALGISKYGSKKKETRFGSQTAMPSQGKPQPTSQ